MLGPPKTAFASSRIGGKGSFDLTPERPVRHPDTDEKNDRFNFRDRFFKDRDATDKDFAGREGKPGPLNGRRGEREDWNAGRPRRMFGPDDQERKPRRNGEFDRWENKEGPRDINAERTPQKEGRFPRAKTDRPHDLNMKEAGSATRTTATATTTRAPNLTRTNHRCATANGARTKPDMALSASGTAVPNLKQSLNGWMPTTETSRDEHIPRKTLSAGRSV